MEKSDAGWGENLQRRFGYAYIVSCGPKSWYKDQVGQHIIVCLVGHETPDGTFVIKYFYDFEVTGSKLYFKKPYSITDLIFL